MKLKHHLWIAFGIIFISIFLTHITTVVEVAGLVELTETNTSLWDMFYDNLLTNNPTNDLIDSLSAFGLDSATAIPLIEKHNLGNSVTTGIFGLLPILLVIGGVVLVSFKKKINKFVFYSIFALLIVTAILVHTGAPGALENVESLFNEVMTGVMPLGTMMSDGTEFSFGIGFYILICASLYGVIVVILNKLGKITS